MNTSHLFFHIPSQYFCITSIFDRTPDVNPTDFPSKEEILKTFSAVYDYIDWERLHSERAKESDIIHMKNKAVTGRYTGPVDKKGRTKIPMVPVRTVSTALTGNRFVDDENQRQRDMVEVKLEPSMKGNGPIPPARVLIWSRLGHDRPCALAAAYLIKCWGINLDKALSSMQIVRGGLKISEPYLQALQSWEDLYAMGASYCEDCIDHVSSRISMMKQKQLDIDTYPILKDGSVERNDIYSIKNYEEKDEKHSNSIYMKFELQMYSEDSEYEQKAAFGLTESFLSPSLGGMKQQGERHFLCKYSFFYIHAYEYGIRTYLYGYVHTIINLFIQEYAYIQMCSHILISGIISLYKHVCTCIRKHMFVYVHIEKYVLSF
jgi:hypothetical protein